jgi:hypothetical protein
MDRNMKQFVTSNLVLAAYLLASKRLQFAGVDAVDPNHADFLFDDPEGSGEAIDIEFGAGDPLVPAASFHRALRSLRHMIDRKGSSSTKIQTIGRFNGNSRHQSAAR